MAEIDPQKMLAASVADFASHVATGIAQAQTALDQAAFALWQQVETDPTLKGLKEIGYQPTWYAIPVAEAEIKMTFYFESEQTSGKKIVCAAVQCQDPNVEQTDGTGHEPTEA